MIGHATIRTDAGTTYHLRLCGEPSQPYHYGGDYPHCETRVDAPEEWDVTDVHPYPEDDDADEVNELIGSIDPDLIRWG